MGNPEAVIDSAVDRGNGGVWLNDEQSLLNPTRVRRVVRPEGVEELVRVIFAARRSGGAISVAGGRHSMGGQQFGAETIHLDMTGFDRILELDCERGLVTVEAGIQWPALIDGLHQRQAGELTPWTIREKQTGVDAVSIGGSLSSNIHGRGLAQPPFVNDIESFELVDAGGKVRHCSRRENSELFSLAIGGYGLFGVISQVTLRLVRRFKVRRKVEVIAVKDLLESYESRLDAGFVFGDCQYAADLSCPAAEHCGVFPCYEPVDIQTPVPETRTELSADDWARLYKLIRTDKQRAFEEYARYYQGTDGQVYWSDTHQLAGNFTGHRQAVDPKCGTEMITDVYLRHDRLLPFFDKVREDLVRCHADITYGTIRFIEADRETFLPWARERSVCVVCNLHVRHTEEGVAKAQQDFRQILDRAIEFDGSFYLTYHRWATPGQIEACYPRIRELFRLKKQYDPDLVFQSDWYRHYGSSFS